MVYHTGDVVGNAYLLEGLEPRLLLSDTPLTLSAAKTLQPGSLIYDQSLSGTLGAPGATATATLSLDAGQTITVVVQPGAGLVGTVELRGPSAGELVAAEDLGLGQTAIVQTIAISTAGTYTLTFAGGGDSTGTFTARVLLNAAIEAESVGVGGNDILAGAQDLNASFISLGGAASRGGVVGSAAAGTVDVYSFDAAAGDVLSIALADPARRGATVELLDASGALLAAGAPGAVNFQQGIGNFAMTAGGRYYVRVRGGLAAGAYSLVVSRNAAIESESNNGLQAAERLGVTGRVLGEAGVTPGRLFAYVYGDSSTRTICELDAQTGAVLKSWNSPDAASVSALATTETTLLIDAYGSSLIYEVDADTFQVLRTFNNPIASTNYAQGLAYLDGAIYIVDGFSPSRLAVVDYRTGQTLRTVTTTRQYSGLAASRDTLYAGSNKDIYRIDPVTGAGTRLGTLDTYANDLAVLGDELFVGDGSYVSVYDRQTLQFRRKSPYLRSSGLGGDMGNPADYYTIQAAPGDALNISTATPADGAGRFDNSLDPRLELYDAAGGLVASDDNSASDGRNAALNYTTAAGGAFQVKVAPVGQTKGEYVLHVDGATAGQMQPFTVTATDPCDGQKFETRPTQVKVTFSGTVLLTTATASKLTLDGVPATAVRVLDGRTLQFDLPPVLEGPHTLAMAAGALTDIQGTPLSAFAATYTVGQFDFPMPLKSLRPAGAMAWYGAVSGAIDPVGEVNSYRLTLAPGQRVTLAMESAAALRAQLTFLDANGGVLGTTSAAQAGRTVWLQAMAASAGGTYTVVVSALAGTTGTFRLSLLLNAALEEEALGGAGNDPGAQSIEGAFRNVGPSAQMATVMGVLGGSAVLNNAMLTASQAPQAAPEAAAAVDTDWYAFSASAGVPVSLALRTERSVAMSLAMFDASGAPVALGDAGAYDTDLYVSSFFPSADGTYYVRIASSSAGSYLLTAVRGAGFDVEPNEDASTAVDITGSHEALGSLEQGLGRLYRVYGTTVEERDAITLAKINQTALGGSYQAAATTEHSVLAGPSTAALPILELDPDTLQVIREIPNPGLICRNMAYRDGEVYVLDYNLVTVLDYRTGKVLRLISPSPGISGLAGGPDGVYGWNNWQVVRFDTHTGLVTPYNTAKVVASGFAITGDRVYGGWTGSDYGNVIRSYDLATLTQQATGSDGGGDMGGDMGLGADWYSIELPAGQIVTISTGTPASGAADRPNTLDPELELRDLAGNLLAVDDNSAGDGHNACLRYVVRQDATYIIRVTGAGTGAGAYSLQVIQQDPASAQMWLVSATPGNGATVSEHPRRIVVEFSLPIDASSLAVSDLLIDGQPATGTVTLLDAYHAAFDLTGIMQAGLRRMEIPAGAVGHIYGNTNVAAAWQFQFDPPAITVAGMTAPPGPAGPWAPPVQIVVDFSAPVRAGAIRADGLLIAGVPAAGATLLDADTVAYDVPAGLPEGLLDVTLQAGAVLDVYGKGNAAFTGQVVFSLPPHVLASSLRADQPAMPGTVAWRIRLDRSVQTSVLDKTDFVLAGGPAPRTADSISYDAADCTITATFLNVAEGSYTATARSASDAIVGPWGLAMDGEAAASPEGIPSGDGVPGGDFSIAFTVDAAGGAFAGEFTPTGPPGAWVHSAIVSGQIAAIDDVDAQQLTLEAGQTLAVTVSPAATLLARVRLLGPDGQLVAQAWGSGAGAPVLLQAVAVVAGTYTLSISTPTEPVLLYGLDSQSDQVYRINAANGISTLVGALGANETMGDLAYGGGRLFAVGIGGFSASSLAEVNPATGRASLIGALGIGMTAGLAWADGTLWAFSYDSADTTIGTVNQATGAFSPVWTIEGVGIVSAELDDSTGVLYGLGDEGALYTVDLAHGTVCPVGETGISFGSFAGLAYCAADDSFYVLGNYPSASQNNLYRVNKATGAATLVGATRLAIGDGLEFLPGPATGSYTVRVVLNAAIEAEALGGPANDAYTRAQNIDGAFLPIPGGAGARAAVLGDVSDTARQDWYGFSVADGQTFSLALSASSASATGLTLYDSKGALLATGSTAINVSRMIDSFTDPVTPGSPAASYYLAVSGGTGEYVLAVTTGVLFERTNSGSTLQSITASPGAVGYAPSAAPGDGYFLDLTAGVVLTLATRTPGAAQGPFDNALDPVVELYNPSGQLVAANDNGAPDGRNALLTWTVATAGRYTVRVRSANGLPGEYVLWKSIQAAAPAVQESLSAPIAPARPLAGAASPPAPLNLVTAFPTPLAAQSPAGAMVSQGAAWGCIALPGDADTHTLDLEPGQTLTLLVDPAGTLRPVVELLAPDGTVLGTAQADLGQNALLQTVALTAGGTYRLRISGGLGTTGRYAVTAVLNAAMEDESQGRGTNDSQAAAQDIDAAFIPTLAGGARAAVTAARADAAGDWYRFSVSGGAMFWLALAAPSGVGTIAVYDAAGALVAMDSPGDIHYTRFIDALYLANGAYYVKVTGNASAPYSLVVGRGLAVGHNVDENLVAPANAQDITAAGSALGQLNDSMSRLFVGYYDQAVIAELDPGTGQILRYFRMTNWPYDTPTGMATTRTSLLAMRGTANWQEINPDTGVVLRTVGAPYATSDAAYINGEVFVLTHNTGAEIGVADYATLKATRTLSVPQARSVSFLAADETSLYVYGYYVSDYHLFRVNPKTGQTDDVGVVKSPSGYFGNGMAIVGEELFLSASLEESGSQFGLVHVFDLTTLAFKRTLRPGSLWTGYYRNFSSIGGDGPFPSHDYYSVQARAGDVLTLRTATPGDASGQPDNPLDAVLELYDASGANRLAFDDNSAPDGHNALLTCTVPADGTYLIRVSQAGAAGGTYLLDVSGYSRDTTPLTASAVTPANGQILSAVPISMRIDFSAPVNVTSLSAAVLKIDGVGAVAFQLVDADTVVFTLPALGEGIRTVTLDSTIRGLQGQPLAAFVSTFQVDLSAPRVVDSPVQEGQIIPAGAQSLLFRFDEPLLPGNLGPEDVSLVSEFYGSFSLSGFVFDAAACTLTLTYPDLPEDRYTLTFTSGDKAFEDRVGWNLDGEPGAWPVGPNRSGNGSPGGDFVVHFATDVQTRPFPPLQAVRPYGFDVFSSEIVGTIQTASDADCYSVVLEADQHLSLLVRPAPGLCPTVALIAPGGQILATATASGAGWAALLQSVPLAAGGAYTVAVSGAGTLGQYTLQATLNAAIERESLDRSDNGSLAAAQDIAGSSVPLAGGADRLAVTGNLGLAAYDGFEGVRLSEGWSIYRNSANALVGLSSKYQPASGAASLFIGPTGNGNWDNIIKDATWGVNLAGLTSATLSFWANSLGGALAIAGPYTGHVKGNGISISQDGEHWVPIWLATQTAWTQYTLNLASAASSAGFSLADPFYIRFQEYSDYISNYRLFDDVAVLTPDAADLYSFDLDVGQAATIAAQSAGSPAVSVELLDAAGTLLAVGRAGAQNVQGVISDFVAPAAGRYYVRVTGVPSARYSLAVTRGAAFDTEPNNATRGSGTQDISSTGVVLGEAGTLDSRLFVVWQTSGYGSNQYIQELDRFSDRRIGPAVLLPYTGFSSRSGAATTDWSILVGNYSQGSIYELDPTTFQTVRTIPLPASNISPDSMTYLDGEIYIRPFSYDPVTTLFVLDYETGRLKRTLTVSHSYTSVSCAGDTLYVADGANLYEADPLTGQATLLGRIPGAQTIITVFQDDVVTMATGSSPASSLSLFDRRTFAFKHQLAGVTDAYTATGGEGSTDDVYTIRADAGDSIHLTTSTPGGPALNALDPRVRLYDPAGNLLASDDNSAPDGRNVLLDITAPASGTYTIRVHAVGQTHGVYVLEARSRAAAAPFRVVASDPGDGAELVVAPQTLTLDFSRGVLLTGLTASDLTVGGLPATSVTVVDGDTLRFTLPALGQGVFDVAVAAGALTGLDGQPVEAYRAHLAVRVFACPALHALPPSGSMAYASDPLAGTIPFAGAAFSHTIYLDAGRTLTATLTPAAGLRGSLLVTDPSGATVASAAVTGSPVILQTIHARTSGTYSVTFTGEGAPTGTYQLELLLNAADEAEGAGLGHNDSLATAQDIDGSFIDLPGLTRGGVSGAGQAGLGAPPSEEDDWYRFTAGPEEFVSLVADSTTPLPLGLELYDSAGRRLATGARGPRTPADVTSLFASYSNGMWEPQMAVIGPDGNLYVSNYAYDNILRFNGTTGAYMNIFAPSSSGLQDPRHLAFGPDGNLYVAERYSGNIRVFNGKTGQSMGVFATGVYGAFGLAFGPDGDLFVSDGAGNTVYRFDGRTGQARGAFVRSGDGGLSNAIGLAFGPDGNLYVASYSTSTILRFDGRTGQYIDRFASPENSGMLAPITLAFGPDGNLYVGAYDSKQVLRFDGHTGKFLDVILDSTTQDFLGPQGIAFAPDGMLYATVCLNGKVFRVDLPRLAAPAAAIARVPLTIEGAYYARVTGNADYTLVVTRSGLFAVEPCNSVSKATFLPPSESVIGGLGEGFFAGDDWFFTTLSAGQCATLRLVTTGPAAGPAADTLDPKIDILDATGAVIASDDNGAPGGRGALVHFTPAVGGVYWLRASASSGSGSYVLVVENNEAPAVSSLALTPEILEDQTASLSGEFVDANLLDLHTVRVDWGDGTVETLPLPAGSRRFDAAHRYLDDNPEDAPRGAYTVTVTVRDDARAEGEAAASVIVHNVAPTIAGLAVMPPAISEGQSTALSGAISDPGVLDTFSIAVDWGDGALEVLSLPAAGPFTLDHRYRDDNAADLFPIRVTVTDDDGGAAEVSVAVSVGNLPPVAASDTYQADPGDMFAPLVVPAATGVLANDTDPAGPLDPLAVTTTGHLISALGALVDMWSDGGFTYYAATSAFLQNLPNRTVMTDSFTYAIGDGDGGTAQATVLVSVTATGENSVRVIESPCGEGGKALIVKGSSWGDRVKVRFGPRTGDYTVTTRLPGDADDDGLVNLGDFGVLKSNFNCAREAAWADGDFTGDGKVDLQDFGILKDHFSEKGPFEYSGNDPAIDKALVFGLGGDDQIDVHSTADVSGWIFGGDGHDDLNGGAGDDVIVGGAGNDRMVGTGGRDVMIGGLGADHVIGNGSQDLLTAGGTSFDGSLPALCLIRSEWLSAAAVGVRVSHLEGAPGGLNGSAVLNTEPARGAVTVFDDFSTDKLSGGDGRDWMLANLRGGDALDKAPLEDGDLFSELQVLWIA